MPPLCKHCGMESDTDRVCSWCGKPIETGAPPAADAPPPASDKAASRPAGPPDRGRHAGAARALLAAERERRAAPVWRYYALGAGILLVLVIGGFLFAYLRALRPPAEPTEWTSVTTETKLFTLQVPANWKYFAAGSTGNFEWTRVTSGTCRVSIEGSQIKGVMGDMASSAARLATGPEGTRPLTLEERAESRLHARLGDAAAHNDPAFRDEGDLEKCKFAGLPAVRSHFTTRKLVGPFSIKMRGLRITATGGGDFSYDLRLTAPAKVYDKFEPIALKIVDSVAPGSA